MSAAADSRTMAIGLVLPPGALRLALAAAVVVSHVTRFDIGRLAVLLFFFLSGYWVSKVWVEKFSGRDWARFYAARYLRIAPLYLIAMLAAAWLLKSPFGLENLTLLGVASSNRDPLGVAWSLDVELQFYLLLPLLVPVVIGWGRWSVAASIALAALAWMLASQSPVVTAIQYLPPFVLGALTYTLAWRPSERTATLSALAFGVFSVAACLTPFAYKTAPDPFDRDIFAFLWMAPLLPYVARSLHVRSGKLDRHMGNLSFPLYLVHYPAILWASAHIGHGRVGTVCGIGLGLAVALALYLILDRRIDAARVALTERP